jgi:hypothetical protein
MEIFKYFDTYEELLDSLLLHEELALFGISTESDRSEDYKKLDLLFIYKIETRNRLFALPSSCADFRLIPAQMRQIQEKVKKYNKCGYNETFTRCIKNITKYWVTQLKQVIYNG